MSHNRRTDVVPAAIRGRAMRRLLGAPLFRKGTAAAITAETRFGAGALTSAALFCSIAGIASAIGSILALEAFVDRDAGLWSFWVVLLIALWSAALIVIGLELADRARRRPRLRTRMKVGATAAYVVNAVLLVLAVIWSLVLSIVALWLVIQWLNI